MSRALLTAVFALLCLAPAPAAAEEADAGITATIQRFTDAVNAGNQQAAIAHFAPDASITEDVAPYRWSGPNAGADWLAAMWANAQRKGMSNISMTLAPPIRNEVEGDRAYAVVPGTLGFDRGGLSERDDGTLTFALQRSGDAWLIGSLTWAGGARATFDGASASVRSQIEAVEAQWAEALLAKDQTTLDRLVAPEFRLEGSGFEAPTPRAEWMANLARMDIRAYDARVTHVRAEGDRAVATVIGDWSVTRGGQVLSDHFELLDTWERRDGAWQVTKRERTNPPPPRTPR